jgi:hypothetical protein
VTSKHPLYQGGPLRGVLLHTAGRVDPALVYVAPRRNYPAVTETPEGITVEWSNITPDERAILAGNTDRPAGDRAMGITITTTYTCDKCGAAATSETVPPGVCTLSYKINDQPPKEGKRILCSSCTQLLATFLSTPPE